jgi:hypothetical protein
MNRREPPGRPCQGRAGVNKHSDVIEGEDLKCFLPQSLAVVDFVADDELELIAQITRQLPSGTPTPRIKIMLHLLPRCEVERSAQNIADHYNEPVSVCDTDGRLLAYRTPAVKNGGQKRVLKGRDC